MEIHLANPRGFCAGVDRAIDIVNRALEVFGAPIYVRHEVVHNKFVVEDLRERGAIFVDYLSEVPDDCIVIFSAHGVSKAVRSEAAKRSLKVFDATCPLVTKVHVEVASHSLQGRECILIGHRGHPEVEGTMGQYDKAAGGDIYLIEDEQQAMDDTARVIDRLHARFPHIQGPRKDDICYATQNRQDAVKQLAGDCDLMLVVGSPNSSNSNRLRELAERMGTEAYLLDGAEDIDPSWLEGKTRIGVTAGASAPEILVQEVLDGLCALGASGAVELEGRPENITFSLPKELRIDAVNI
jgi:4-hydroxy-3-methylbut-2-enyl diphosphate reductase